MEQNGHIYHTAQKTSSLPCQTSPVLSAQACLIHPQPIHSLTSLFVVLFKKMFFCFPLVLLFAVSHIWSDASQNELQSHVTGLLQTLPFGLSIFRFGLVCFPAKVNAMGALSMLRVQKSKTEVSLPIIQTSLTVPSHSPSHPYPTDASCLGFQLENL